MIRLSSFREIDSLSNVKSYFSSKTTFKSVRRSFLSLLRETLGIQTLNENIWASQGQPSHNTTNREIVANRQHVYLLNNWIHFCP